VTRNSQPLPGLGDSKQLQLEPKFTAVYLDWQKRRYRDRDGN